MAKYSVDEEQPWVVDQHGSIIFTTRIGGISPLDQRNHAQFIADTLNGIEVDLPPEIDRHWMWDEKPGAGGTYNLTTPGAYPRTLGNGQNNRWVMFARFANSALAKKLCDYVNARLEWDFNGDQHQNVINNKFLTIKHNQVSGFEAYMDYYKIGDTFVSLNEAQEALVQAATLPAPTVEQELADQTKETTFSI